MSVMDVLVYKDLIIFWIFQTLTFGDVVAVRHYEKA